MIGLELGSVYERLGSKVTVPWRSVIWLRSSFTFVLRSSFLQVVEFLPTIGGIGIDGEVSKEMKKILILSAQEVVLLEGQFKFVLSPHSSASLWPKRSLQ